MTAAANSEVRINSARIWSSVALGGVGSAVALVTPLALVVTPRSETVVLVGRTGSDTGEAIRLAAAAGGSILNVGGRPGVVITRSESAGFTGRLYAAGARLVLDGALAGGCRRADEARTTTRDRHPETERSER